MNGNLELCDVSFRYQTRSRDSPFSLSACNLLIQGGQTFGILGPSGAGKSTLLSIIAGHLRPTGGTVLLGGQDLTRRAVGSRGIITVFQEDALFPHLTVGRNVAYGLEASGRFARSEIKSRVRQTLKRLDILAHIDDLPGVLSVGEKQRVSLARALVTEPPVLLLDEPTASLDSIRRDNLMLLLRDAIQSDTHSMIVIVSHDRDFVLGLCSAVALLDNGSILCQDTTHNLLTAPPSRRAAEILGSHIILDGELIESGSFFRLSQSQCIPVLSRQDARLKVAERHCTALIRRSEISIQFRQSSADRQMGGKILRLVPATNCTLNEVQLETGITLEIPSVAGATQVPFSPGDFVSLVLSDTALNIVDRA